MKKSVETLIQELSQLLQLKNWKITTAESCTGGGLAYMLTSFSGSSAWFDSSFVTYSDRSKHTMLGVPVDLINQEGAVSLAVARAMAEGALERSGVNFAIAVTGIAGPLGGTLAKPVGTVCFAWGSKKKLLTQLSYFQGTRTEIREQSIEFGLIQAISFMKSNMRDVSMQRR